MKLNKIEQPKVEIQGAKTGLLYIISDGDMSSLFGGTNCPRQASCGDLTECGKTGQNSCKPYTCPLVTSCTGTRTWLSDMMVGDLGFEF